MELGQAFSCSHSAGIIAFRGGPYDGHSGLYDDNGYDVMSFCDLTKKMIHEYVPEWKGISWVYVFKRSYRFR